MIAFNPLPLHNYNDSLTFLIVLGWVIFLIVYALLLIYFGFKDRKKKQREYINEVKEKCKNQK
jgi:phosphotransferase system  glucose/maltose/N-acetylglucosamine-specific IIC component